MLFFSESPLTLVCFYIGPPSGAGCVAIGI